MARIIYDNQILYDPAWSRQNPQYDLLAANLHLRVGEAGLLTFSIDVDHPMSNKLYGMGPVIEVKDSGATIFRGRVLGEGKVFYNTKTFQCEEALAFFNDSTVPPFSFPDNFWKKQTDPDQNVVEFFLGALIENHNSQVGADRQIHLGTVTVKDPNNYLYRASEDWASTWDILDQKLQKSNLGGYLCLRYTANATYLDYVEAFPYTNIQKVEYAKNLTDLNQNRFWGDMYTAILPIGKDGLLISDLPDGPLTGDLVKEGPIIYDAKAEQTHGRIRHIEKWPDVTVAENLREKAAQQLAQMGVSFPETIECKACDLSGIEDVPTWRCGRYVEVVSKPHGISAFYPLVELKINLLDPGDTDITLSRVRRSFVGDIHDQTAGIIDTTNKDIEQKYQDLIKHVELISSNLSTSIKQDAEAIVIGAMSEYVTKETLGDTVTDITETFSSKLAATSKEYTLQFQEMSDAIQNVDGDAQRRHEEITTWFRASIDGLEIGKTDSPMKLKVSNDRISFLDNGYEVAYFNGNMLYVRDASFLGRLQLGNFAFVVRENQAISLVKVS